MVVALISSAAMAAVQVNFHDGFEPYTPHHVQMQVITQYFNATPKQIRLAARDLDTIDEMTVAFFLSRESGKKIQRVLRRRASGESWWQLMQELDVGASWLYRDNLLQLRSTWNRKVSSVPKVAFKPMKDARFEDLVGAQVTGEYFHTAPSLVLDARAQGKSFRNIQYTFFHIGRGQNPWLLFPVLDADRPARSPRTQTIRPAQAPAPVPAEDAKLSRPRVGQRPFFE
ncbi:MAG: hypothetical protein V3U11_14220 [Planctomycetota bacterium]